MIPKTLPQEFKCVVKNIRMLTPSVFELSFETDRRLEFAAGQFLSVVIPGAGPKGRDLRRAYSIASSPEAELPTLCVKLVESGPGTHYLYKLKPGQEFNIFAPYGDFIYQPINKAIINKAINDGERHVYFIATGTGLSPFRSMALSKNFRDHLPLSATCLFGTREEAEILYADDFKALPFLKWVPAISRPSASWSGFRGRVTDYLLSLDSEFPWLETDYYLCGSGAMIEEVKAWLLGKGVPKEAIRQEVYYRHPKNPRS